ncbi:M67 family metallopeptidase [Novosphingobium guangzhouense]|uniref:Peptidase n=1 Tax=Novosphingobium guangzhouense TaxID=1850347 RepID=A0A2K2FW12_9SPHN|nr:M67 family metallopeptidase [Novosphingobium guangzhouense]PNU02976.1 peptidase [Novosphingobium guangzhouense]
MIVEVTSGVLATLNEEARKAAAEECCGLLLGRGARIEQAVPAANVAADRTVHFEIDPRSLLSAFKAARAGGPEVIGYYHSHPTGICVPSKTDKDHSTGDSRIWAIISESEVAFWRDNANGFVAQPFRVVG